MRFFSFQLSAHSPSSPCREMPQSAPFKVCREKCSSATRGCMQTASTALQTSLDLSWVMLLPWTGLNITYHKKVIYNYSYNCFKCPLFQRTRKKWVHENLKKKIIHNKNYVLVNLNFFLKLFCIIFIYSPLSFSHYLFI